MERTSLLKSLLLLCALVVGCADVWAETSTLTFTAACSGSGTANDGVAWTVTSDGSESNYDSTKGIHYGTNSAQVTYITLSTSGISGTITKVVVNASTASGVAATASVTVGGEAFGGEAQSISSTATDYTFNGSASGEIVVTVTKPSKAAKALYVKSVAVTYTADPVAVTAVSIPSTAEVIKGKTVKLTPTFTPANATNKNVTWESDDTDIATVDGNGVVTGVAEGTTNITVITEEGNFKSTCVVTVTDGAINLASMGAITFNTFNGDVLGSGGYKTQDCELTASNGSVYTWHETDGMYNNSGWQVKSGGHVTSPTIKSVNGFTITVTHSTAGYDVTISDGTNEGTNSLTTTKTNTTITLSGKGGYTVITGITITPLPKEPSDPVDNGGTITLTTTDNMAGWRSFYDASQGYTADENTTVYVATANASDKVTLTDIGSKNIPAGTPVVLKTTDPGHEMTLTKATVAAYTGANELKVTTAGTPVTDVYRLGYKAANGIGFYKYSAASPAAGIVYVENVTPASEYLPIDVEDADITTGIAAIENGQWSMVNGQSKQVYNLNGQRVSQPTKGLYIVNGKKVIVK